MNFDMREEGDYRIFVGAIESSSGQGFIAAVVVEGIGLVRNPRREIFRDCSLACGHAWPSATVALQFAMRKGIEVARDANAQHRRWGGTPQRL
jgi:hypothetical protein